MDFYQIGTLSKLCKAVSQDIYNKNVLHIKFYLLVKLFSMPCFSLLFLKYARGDIPVSSEKYSQQAAGNPPFGDKSDIALISSSVIPGLEFRQCTRNRFILSCFVNTYLSEFRSIITDSPPSFLTSSVFLRIKSCFISKIIKCLFSEWNHLSGISSSSSIKIDWIYTTHGSSLSKTTSSPLLMRFSIIMGDIPWCWSLPFANSRSKCFARDETPDPFFPASIMSFFSPRIALASAMILLTGT